MPDSEDDEPPNPPKADAPYAETHQRVWSAIDRVADDNAMSASALAKVAGLDATAFNPSKRVGKDGRLRWPSMETVAKVMAAANIDFLAFARLIDGASQPRAAARAVPVWRMSATGALRAGDPAEAGFRLSDPDAFWLEFDGELPDDLIGVYGLNDRLLISPNTPHEPERRVAIGALSGEIRIGRLILKDDAGLTIRSLRADDDAETLVAYDTMAWSGRILWASQ